MSAPGQRATFNKRRAKCGLDTQIQVSNSSAMYRKPRKRRRVAKRHLQ